jgi:hypothetical protein
MALSDKTTIIVCLVVGIVVALINIWLNHLVKRSRREMIKALDAAIEAAEECQRVADARGADDSPGTWKEADDVTAG